MLKIFRYLPKLWATFHRCSIENLVMLSFSTFKCKHLRRSLFLNKVAGLQPTTLFKKCLLYKCFPVNFAKFSEHIFCRTSSLTAPAKYPLVSQAINLAFFYLFSFFFRVNTVDEFRYAFPGITRQLVLSALIYWW